MLRLTRVLPKIAVDKLGWHTQTFSFVIKEILARRHAVLSVQGAGEPCAALKDSAPEVVVGALEWGKGMEGSFAPPYDFVFGCDIMYIREAVPSLVETLVQLSNESTKILFA